MKELFNFFQKELLKRARMRGFKPYLNNKFVVLKKRWKEIKLNYDNILELIKMLDNLELEDIKYKYRLIMKATTNLVDAAQEQYMNIVNIKKEEKKIKYATTIFIDKLKKMYEVIEERDKTVVLNINDVIVVLSVIKAQMMVAPEIVGLNEMEIRVKIDQLAKNFDFELYRQLGGSVDEY